MAKEKAKHIHIEDGNAEEKEKAAAEEVTEEAAAEEC